MKHERRIPTLSAFVALSLFVGCGGDPYERIVVTGNVTFDGEPIQDGMIRFIPTTQTPTPPNGGYIKDGKYKIGTRGGVAVGEYKVVIEAFRGASSTPDQPVSAVDSAGQPEELEAGQFLPKKYNEQSELVVTIDSGSEEMTKDFALTP